MLCPPIKVFVIFGYEITALDIEDMKAHFESYPSSEKYEFRYWKTGWGIRKHTGKKSDRTVRFKFGMGGEHPEHPGMKFFVFNPLNTMQLLAAGTWMMKSFQHNARMVLGLDS